MFLYFRRGGLSALLLYFSKSNHNLTQNDNYVKITTNKPKDEIAMRTIYFELDKKVDSIQQDRIFLSCSFSV